MTSTGEVRVREAALPADADALARVYLSSAEHHVGIDAAFYRIPELDVVADRYRRQSGEPEAVILVAEVGDELVGMASVQVLPLPSEASMVVPVPSAAVDVAVLPRFRGRGIGERLMRAAEVTARAGGARRIVLDAASANEHAVRFYQVRLGYRPFGVLLEKPLPAEHERSHQRRP